MSNEEGDVRCKGCGRLLAKVTNGRLTVQRGDLNATFEGAFRAALVCSQPMCRRMNSIEVVSQTAPRIRLS